MALDCNLSYDTSITSCISSLHTEYFVCLQEYYQSVLIWALTVCKCYLQITNVAEYKERRIPDATS